MRNKQKLMCTTSIETLYRIFRSCKGVTTDSRNCPAGSLFFALKGENFDGNTFAAKALEAGCAYAVVDSPEHKPAGDTRYPLVDDSLQTLQQLARLHRRTLGIPLLGITGTNGKTTTKELIAAVLSEHINVLYTQGNLNNHIGVPLTLLGMKPEHQLAVVEMGASHPGDIRELVEIAEPNYGLITNVGKAHLQGFGSFEGVVRTKGELYDYLRRKGGCTVFLNDDDPHLKAIATGLQTVCYGNRQGLYVSGHATACSPFLSFEWQAAGQTAAQKVQTQLIGAYNLPNALAAVTIGRYFGIGPARINHALENYVPRNNRSQLKRTGSNTLIVDAYNANPTSMQAALENFRDMQAENKMLILGDMRELGADSHAEHCRIVEYMQECGFTNVRLVGAEFTATGADYPCYPDAKALIDELKKAKPTGQTILIKGSNSMQLATVAEYL